MYHVKGMVVFIIYFSARYSFKQLTNQGSIKTKIKINEIESDYFENMSFFLIYKIKES